MSHPAARWQDRPPLYLHPDLDFGPLLLDAVDLLMEGKISQIDFAQFDTPENRINTDWRFK